MADLLRELEVLIARLPDRAFFCPPAGRDAITGVERTIGRALPSAYKRFLSAHDGGFIAGSPVAAAFATQRWNANHLLGCEDLVRDYEDDRLLARDVEPTLVDWPYVPFCRTNGQETLVFGPTGPDGEPPVLDAFHEVGPGEWGVLAKSFADFLRTYIDGDGFPPTIASPQGQRLR